MHPVTHRDQAGAEVEVAVGGATNHELVLGFWRLVALVGVPHVHLDHGHSFLDIPIRRLVEQHLLSRQQALSAALVACLSLPMV